MNRRDSLIEFVWPAVWLLVAAFVLSTMACAQLPKVPHHVQYGNYPQVNPPGFYGVDNESNAHIYKAWSDPDMVGAQCLTREDYKKWADWIQTIEQMAERRCH